MTDEDLISIRRTLHRIPEPSWCEFETTATLIDLLEQRDVDELYVGSEVIESEYRMGVPETSELQTWYDRAVDSGVDRSLLEKLEGGHTGAIAVVRQGEGPTVGLRVDIDGLPREESEDADHVPASDGFRSTNDGAMHACGHDAHMTIGIGVIDAIRQSDFSGTLKVIFQPAEEVVGGARSMAESEHVSDLDYLFAVHIGLDHPTGEIVAGFDGFLAVAHIEAEISGVPAHAGARPERGRNAVHALATAIENLYGIPRHADGETRVNVGRVDGGTAANIIAERASMVGEVRGETTELKEYMKEKATHILQKSAELHDCSIEVTYGPEAPSARSDPELSTIVREIAKSDDRTEQVIDSDSLGGSEDATYLMQAVQRNGGLACYIGVGTDHPGGHHTETFDVDERSIGHGVDVLAGAIVETANTRP